MTPSRQLTHPDGFSSAASQGNLPAVEIRCSGSNCNAQSISTDPMALVLVRKLSELSHVLSQLNDDQYGQKPVGVIPSSIGGHVRHALDHVKALLDAQSTGQLDYDHRQRNTPVETCRAAAIQRIADLTHSIVHLTTHMLAQPLSLIMMIDPASPSVQVPSTFQRELGYVVSHMIHHNAIISAMITTLGGTLPPGFGFAPSTLAAQDSPSHLVQANSQIQSCAR